jgi:hypothetical protein
MGSLLRVGDNLSVAAVATNLNRNRFDGIRSRIEWQEESGFVGME